MTTRNAKLPPRKMAVIRSELPKRRITMTM